MQINWTTVQKKVDDLLPAEYNPRRMTDEQAAQLEKSLTKFGLAEIPAINTDGTILAGHQRVVILKRLGKGDELIDVRIPSRELTDEEAKEYNLRSNKNTGEWDTKSLVDNFEVELLKDVGFDVDKLLFESNYESRQGESKGKLLKEWGVAPFTILDSRSGPWMERKRSWIDLGISSELGRGLGKNTSSSPMLDAAFKNSGKLKEGGSIFDPALAEILYKWFVPKDGLIIDPFAGGSVRGIVAGLSGFDYLGIELREEQVNANIAQGEDLLSECSKSVTWVCGDSMVKLDTIEDNSFDFIFSCPPYLDLEVYSDDKADLSNMPAEKFDEFYSEIIRKACSKLKDNRFAAFVVGDVRKKDGSLSNFIGMTIRAFEKAGLRFYNEAVYVTPIGNLALRTSAQFKSSRKFGKMHQNVLIFVKGDAKKATGILPEAPFYEDPSADELSED